MKKILSLLVLSLVMFVAFYLYLTTSPAVLVRFSKAGFLLLIILGVGAFRALTEALFIAFDLYLKPFLQKRFPKWA